MKLAIIGASYKFVKRVINDFILNGQFEESTITVMDISEETLDIVVRTAQTIIEGCGSKIRITGTTNRTEVLQGADFVLVSISAGGIDAMQNDRRIIREFGLLPGKENTSGPGALMESLRIVPVMVDIAKDMERICPDAWMINVSNPMAANVQAVSRYSNVKVLGLCHGSADGIKTLAQIYGVDPSNVTVQMIGVNHMTFATDIHISGESVMHSLYDDYFRAAMEATPHHGRVSIEFFKQTGYFPLLGDGYLPAFLPYLLKPENLDDNTAWEQREALKKLHLGIVNGEITDFAPTDFSGEDIHGIILSLYEGQAGNYIVNIPNQQINPELIADAVIETPARISKDKIEGVKVDEGVHAPWMIAAIRNWNVVHHLIVESAENGDAGKAKEALFLDPVTRNADVTQQIPQLVEALIEGNRKFLPDFK